MIAASPPVPTTADAAHADGGTTDRTATRGAVPWLGLALSALVGLAVRLVYTIHWRYDAGLKYDGATYFARSQGLLAGRSFTDPEAWFFRQTYSENAVHPPGATIWLAIGDRLGFHGGHGAQLFGTVLGTATIVVVGLLAWQLAGRGPAVFAAAIVAVHPGFWALDPTAMADSPAQFCTALLLVLLYRFWDAPTDSKAGWLGLVAAACALFRSELILYLPLLVAPVCLLASPTWRRRLRHGAIALLWAGLALSPWVGWNLVRFEHPVPFATGFDVSLGYAQCDPAWYGENTGFWSVLCSDKVRAQAAADGVDESELGRRTRAQAEAYAKDHLGRGPVVVAARVGRTLGVYQPIRQLHLSADVEGKEFGVVAAGAVFTLLTAVLAAVAWWRWPGPRRRLVPLLVPLLAGLAGAALTFGSIRYRAPGEVGLVVLAAIGIPHLLRRPPPETQRPTSPSA